MRGIVILAGLLFGVSAARSVGWGLLGDAPLYHYIAWLIDQGLVPYRDIIDFNMPAVHLLHLGVIKVGGVGDRTWRLFDLGWLALTLALLFIWMRPLAGRSGAIGLAIVFGLFHLLGGPWMAGQRDYLLCALLLAGLLGVARFWERQGPIGPLWAAGLALGAAMAIKPHAGLLWLGAAMAAAVAARQLGRHRWLAPVAVLAGGAVIPLAVFGWLAYRGGLASFLGLMRDYALPFYGPMGPGPLAIWKDLPPYVHGWPVLPFLAFLALLGALAPAPRTMALRRWCAGMGVIYGVLHYTLQKKGYPYHLYPLACFLLVAAAPALAGLHRALGAESWRSLLHWMSPFGHRQVALPLAAWAVLAGIVALAGGGALLDLGHPESATFARRVDAITGELERLVPAGEAVQIMDDTHANGLHALLRLGILQPSPFIYDFPLFGPAEEPEIRRLRAKFRREVLAAPPAAFVVSEVTANRTGYERLRELPALRQLLGQRYGLAVRGDGYEIYLRNDLAYRTRAAGGLAAR